MSVNLSFFGLLEEQTFSLCYSMFSSVQLYHFTEILIYRGNDVQVFMQFTQKRRTEKKSDFSHWYIRFGVLMVSER